MSKPCSAATTDPTSRRGDGTVVVLLRDVVDRFVAPSARTDPAELRRQRLTAGAALAILANAVPLMIMNWLTVRAVGLTVVCFAVGIPAMAANLVALRSGWSRERIATVVAAELFVFTSVMTLDSGGIDSAALWWLVVVPMVAVLLRGPQLGWTMAACVGLAAAVLVGLDQIGVVIPSPLTAAQGRVWHGLGLSSVALFVAALSCHYERGRLAAHAALVEAQSELTRAAHTAGMAEIASGVLHNVGNALNSVGVSVDLVNERVQGLDGAKLHSFVQRARAQPSGMSALCASDGGERVLSYLSGVGNALDVHHQHVQREVAVLRRHLDHIKVVVGKQQAHARYGGHKERCRIAGIIDDAVLLVGASGARRPIEIEISGDPEINLHTDPHQVLQVLVNLLGNARDAARGTERAKVAIDVRELCVGVVVTVRDNGCGMTAAQLSKLFTYGFTTKRDGHGFGLHNAAIAVEQMGGRLQASSEGPGLGATFTLTLPAVAASSRPPRAEPTRLAS